MLNKTVTVEVRSIVTVFCFAGIKGNGYLNQSRKETNHET